MKTFKELHKLLHLLFLALNFFSTACLPSSSFCGELQIQSPFSDPNNSTAPSLLNSMLLCRSKKLYLRTSIGLFPVSSIDYTTKTLTISHSPSCSSSRRYVSPSRLSAGFPAPPQPNSLLLFNCLSKNHSLSFSKHNCSSFDACKASSKARACFLVNDLEKLSKSFHPKELNCSHHSHVYRKSLIEDSSQDYELGTRISFDIPDHVPDLCRECEKPNGNCGVALRCICHAQECKDKVISMAASLRPFGNLLFPVLPFLAMFITFNQEFLM